MAKNIIDMGEYYNANSYGLVRTVCRGIDYDSGEKKIAYVNVGDDGLVSEVFFMEEGKFANIFLH